MPHFLATKYQRGLITPGLDRLSLESDEGRNERAAFEPAGV